MTKLKQQLGEQLAAHTAYIKVSESPPNKKCKPVNVKMYLKP